MNINLAKVKSFFDLEQIKKGASRIGSKILKPVGIITDITDNLGKKTWKDRAAGISVDLASDGICTIVGAIIGSAIPFPVVGTIVGAGIGAGLDKLMDNKTELFNDKSAKEWAKDNLATGFKKLSKGLRLSFSN